MSAAAPTETPNPQAEAEAKLKLAETMEMAGLKSEQHHRESDEQSTAQIAETTLSLLLEMRRKLTEGTLSQELAKPHWQQVFESIKKRNQELPNPGDLEGAMEGTMAILERQPPFFQNFPDSGQEQPGVRNAEHETAVALMTLMLRGHLTGSILQKIVPGGIIYQSEPFENNTGSDLENIACFKHGDKNNLPRIILGARLFKKTTDAEGRPLGEEIEDNTLQVVAHELAHAEITGGLVYHWPDLTKLIQNPEAAEPTPTLSDVERRTLERTYREPLRQQAWEPPYIATLLKEFQAKGRPHAEWGRVVNEMVTERRRIFLESDGSFSGFLQKRLENAEFFQNYLTKVYDKGPVSAAPAQEGFAVAFHDFVTKMPLDNPKIVKQGIEMFVSSLNLPDTEQLKPDLNDFLLESYVLYLRFNQLRGKDRQTKLMKNIEEGKLLMLGDDFADDLLGYENVNLGKPPVQKPKEKSLWQWLGEAFIDMGRALKGMAQ